MTAGKTKRLVPIVGYVDTKDGSVHLPPGFLDALEVKLEKESGKQIFTNCTNCGMMVVTREKKWTGVCGECKGNGDS